MRLKSGAHMDGRQLILHELDRCIAIMNQNVVPEKDLGLVSRGLGRIVKIQSVLVDQMDILGMELIVGIALGWEKDP